MCYHLVTTEDKWYSFLLGSPLRDIQNAFRIYPPKTMRLVVIHYLRFPLVEGRLTSCTSRPWPGLCQLQQLSQLQQFGNFVSLVSGSLLRTTPTSLTVTYHLLLNPKKLVGRKPAEGCRGSAREALSVCIKFLPNYIQNPT